MDGRAEAIYLPPVHITWCPALISATTTATTATTAPTTSPSLHAMVSELLCNPWFVGLAIPIAFIIIGAFIRQIVDKEAGREEWLLGIELAFAACTITLADLADWTRHHDHADRLQMAAIYLGCEILGFICIMWLHTTVLRRVKPPATVVSWRQFCILFFAGNIGGGALLGFYLAFIKGLD